MNVWKEKLLIYRERFRRVDRRWHILIGSQLLFVMAVVRFRAAQQQQRQDLRIQTENLTSGDSPSSATGSSAGGK
ncbi:hypothetical protein IV203_016728 [Nitzschia inconspicua]|uniref:Uncharacterized protein n=1 Tax=Nitzschia inconspicua TaxID=303405 RepID=A0A9K3KQB9_9STRA|nr:hypothetical protein IV203_016728 [Nitzschia inconspicua]